MSYLIKRVVFALLISTAPFGSVPAQATPRQETEQKSETVIAVADFTGNDKELGRFLSETLLTQLAQSEKLALVERTEIRQALSELKLQSTGLFEPQQVKKIGKMLSADCVVVGSYLVRENQIIVNARLLDVKTGRLRPGGAASVAGSRDDILTITGKLARLFHKRVTGVELGAKAETDLPSRRHSTQETVSSPASSTDLTDRFAQWKQEGLLPANARPGTVVTERDFGRLIEGLKQRLPIGSEVPLTLMQPGGPISRLRAVTALLKLTYPATRLAEFHHPSLGDLPTDSHEAPAWGLPYLALATAQGWWNQDSPFKARNVANWAFVSALMEHLPLEERREISRERVTRDETSEEVETYTGLVIEAANLNPQRSMSPRILDEDGQVVYPDPKHLPDDDLLQDIGMASYYRAGQETARAGSRPLVVRAIGCVGPLQCDLVVSRQTAEEIRRANRAGRFLWKWAIGIIADSPK